MDNEIEVITRKYNDAARKLKEQISGLKARPYESIYNESYKKLARLGQCMKLKDKYCE